MPFIHCFNVGEGNPVLGRYFVPGNSLEMFTQHCIKLGRLGRTLLVSLEMFSSKPNRAFALQTATWFMPVQLPSDPLLDYLASFRFTSLTHHFTSMRSRSLKLKKKILQKKGIKRRAKYLGSKRRCHLFSRLQKRCTQEF